MIESFSFLTATSFGKSVAQNLLPLSELMPEQLSSSLPYLLTLLLGIFLYFSFVSI